VRSTSVTGADVVVLRARAILVGARYRR